ncbi:hypothetical protein HN51_066671, partial [Arachis hypogaea]
KMGENVEQVSSRSNSRVPTLCEECKSNPSKYKCPGCSIQSCGLPCVKAHKERTGCTGKRNQTQFVPLSQFDDNLLLSDYNLLEEVKRVAESSQRMRTKLGMYAYFKLPHYLKSLGSAARSRRTKLLFLPSGMSKRQKNQTRYDQRKKFISWTIEWHFHSTDVVLHDNGVNENTSIYSILEKHLKPGPWNHPLRQFCEEQPDRLKIFIRKYPKGPKSPFKELDMKAPIRQQLADVVILEFPVVFVFLPSHRIDFEVIKNVNQIDNKSLPKDSEDGQEPEGVSFREEEIEDDSTDPQVLDLMKNLESSTSNQVPTHNMSSEKAPTGSSDKPLFEEDTVGNPSHSSLKNKELKISEDMTFDFDPELMDVYANLMADMNPDNFLDFDGEFSKKTDNEIGLIGTNGVLPVPEELEEGEIPE